MEWLLVTLNIYRKVFARAGTLAVRNWPVMGSVFIYGAIMSGTAVIAAYAGIAGGFLLSFVWAACVGSFLYLVEMIVRTNKVTLEDFRNSFGAYLWDVIGITFLLWIFSSLALPALAQVPQGTLLALCAEIAIFVLFNAVPELIYLGHYSTMALLSESYAFIAANWIEWFPANIAAVAIIVVVRSLPIHLGTSAFNLKLALLALVVYFAMVMRGLLFLELHNSTHRSRAFKYRMGG